MSKKMNALFILAAILIVLVSGLVAVDGFMKADWWWKQ